MMRDDPIELYRSGAISAPVAISRLLLSGATAEQILVRTDPHGALAQLARAKKQDLSDLGAMLAQAGIQHDTAEPSVSAAIAKISEMFDQAVTVSPEASVALYSLGDARLLDQATAELVGWLEREQLTGPDADVLDLGCGIGRVAAALAPRCRGVIGIDVSAQMIATARKRYADVPGLRFETTNGASIAFPDGSFDLVLAVDVFPYVVQAGEALARWHVANAARLLRPGGALAIFNLSYRSDIPRDLADLQAWAQASALATPVATLPDFTIWDATAFVSRK
jgi:ubiquinone/menaquinone biosynthesis C-methylase UbiE